MFLAHIFLPAILFVICKSQQAPVHLTYGSDENVYNVLPTSDTFAIPTNAGRSELLDRYRQLTAKSLVKMYDSCKVHDFLQNLKHNMENDIDDEETLKSGLGKSAQQRYINTLLRMLEKQQAFDNDVTLLFSNDGSVEKPKSALYYYITISMLLQDKELDTMISHMLFEKCCKNDENFFTSSVCSQNDDEFSAQKRDTIKKVKFHSWGGKRSIWTPEKRSGGNGQSNVRMPTNADLGKDLSQSKIVIRTPFRPWGGK